MPRKAPEPVPAGSKWCADCAAAKPIAEFNVDRHRRDGLRSYCKPHDTARTKAAQQRKKDVALIGKLATTPHKVTPDQREALSARFVDAMTETSEARASRLPKAKPATAAKVAKAPRPRRYPPGCCAMFPTPADARNWERVCGNRG